MGYISKHFTREEFLCKGDDCHPSATGNCGFDTVDVELLRTLEAVRAYFGKPVIITSGCRCMAHNESEGGSRKSQHLIGRAADIIVQDVDPDDVADWFDSAYPESMGLGRYSTFTHIDSRSSKARWEG